MLKAPVQAKNQPLDVERNKQNVVASYDLMFNQCRPREAIERYVGVEYVQHNPGVKLGKQEFIEYFEELHMSSLGSGRMARMTGHAAGNLSILDGQQIVAMVTLVALAFLVELDRALALAAACLSPTQHHRSRRHRLRTKGSKR